MDLPNLNDNPEVLYHAVAGNCAILDGYEMIVEKSVDGRIYLTITDPDVTKTVARTPAIYSFAHVRHVEGEEGGALWSRRELIEAIRGKQYVIE